MLTDDVRQTIEEELQARYTHLSNCINIVPLRREATLARMEGIRKALAAIDTAALEMSMPVEVQPPQHLREMVAMELGCNIDELRFVLYNDAERGEWLRPQMPEWEVVPDTHNMTPGDYKRGREDYIWQDGILYTYNDGRQLSRLALPDDIRLCRRRPTQD